MHQSGGDGYFGNGLIIPSLRVAEWGVEAMPIVGIALQVKMLSKVVLTAKIFYFEATPAPIPAGMTRYNPNPERPGRPAGSLKAPFQFQDTTLPIFHLLVTIVAPAGAGV